MIMDSVLDLEAMRVSDSSWHHCEVSLCSTGPGLFVDFPSLESEDITLKNKEEALRCLRVRSVPLQGDDCLHIEQGVRVLAACKSRFKSLFFDAEVEKVLRVRHSKKIHCRCSFEIKWLHEELNGEIVTLPSTSIMRLSAKSIETHPVIASFLNSKQTLDCSSIKSPLMSSLLDMDFEMELHNLLEKQIDEIGNLLDPCRFDISEDILLGVQKGNDNGEVWCKLVEAPPVVSPRAQVLRGQNNSKRSTRSKSKQNTEVEAKEPVPPPPVPEEPLQNRYLSPLAARAALASLMSKLPEKVEFPLGREYLDGTHHKHVNKESLDEANSFVDIVSSNKTRASNKPPKNGENASQVIISSTKAARLTRSTIQKTTRSTRSAGQKGHLTNEDEDKSLFEEYKSDQDSESDSEEKTTVPKSNVSMKKKAVSTPLDADIKPNKTKRFTRSAGHKGHFTNEEEPQEEEDKADQNLESVFEETMNIFKPLYEETRYSAAETNSITKPISTKRLTRSGGHKGHFTIEDKPKLNEDDADQALESASEESTPVPNSNVSGKKKATKSTRFTRSSLKPQLNEDRADQNLGSDSEENTIVPMSIVSRKKKVVSKPLDDDMKPHAVEMSSISRAQTTRFTRSGGHKGHLTNESELQVEEDKTDENARSNSEENTTVRSSNVSRKKKEDTNSITSIKRTRLTRSALPTADEDKEEQDGGTNYGGNSTVPSEPTHDETKSRHIDEKREKQMSGATCHAPKTEGKISENGGSGHGQKRGSTSSKKQEARFSPRLRFSPRTR